MGFNVTENDQYLFVHPVTKMRVGTHVDDLLIRGRQKDKEEFWAAITKEFGVKSCGIVTEDKPLSYLSMQISIPLREAKCGTILTKQITFINS